MNSESNMQYHSGLDLTGQIVAVTLAVIFTVLIFFVCLHFWARCCQQGSVGASQRLGVSAGRRWLVFGGDRDPARPRRGGLEKSVIESLPVFVYQSAEHKGRLECAVCLCEFEENEKARLLPNCNHSFHVGCIDMWFHSHSNCPLCRSAVRPDASATVVVVGQPSGTDPATDQAAPSSVSVDGSPSEQRRGAESASETGKSDGPCASCRLDDGLPSPTNGTRNLDRIGSRLSSCNLDRGTSSPKALGKIVIDIPRRADGFPSPRLFTGDEQQGYSLGGPSSKSPGPRLRSLKRLLSTDKKAVPQSPCGPDLERAGQAQT